MFQLKRIWLYNTVATISSHPPFTLERRHQRSHKYAQGLKNVLEILAQSKDISEIRDGKDAHNGKMSHMSIMVESPFDLKTQLGTINSLERKV